MPRAPPPDVAAYLARQSPEHREALLRIRDQILAAAPKATERISYGIIGFFDGRGIGHIAGFKAHCTLFLGARTAELAREFGVTGHTVTKGGIHFTRDAPLPAAFVKRGIKIRMAENLARDTKKKPRATGTSAKARAPARKSARAR